MGASDRISALARRMAEEVKTKIGAGHPGVADAWAVFGYRRREVILQAGWNVETVGRIRRGHYVLYFKQALASADYACQPFTAVGYWGRYIEITEQTPFCVEMVCRNGFGLRVDSPYLNLLIFE